MIYYNDVKSKHYPSERKPLVVTIPGKKPPNRGLEIYDTNISLIEQRPSAIIETGLTITF